MSADAPNKSTAMQFDVGGLRTGDIVFVYDQSRGWWNRIRRFLNVNGQRVLAFLRRTERLPLKLRIEPYSHVMLGVGGGVIIHADGKTVSVEVVTEALRFSMRDASRFRVYRRDDVSDELGQRIAKAAIRYLNTRYRFTTYFDGTVNSNDLGEDDTTQFCSRLVAHAYRSGGIILTALADSRVLPVDLFQVCQLAPWRDVTDELLEAPFSSELAGDLGSIDVPEFGKMTIDEFFQKIDQDLRSGADQHKKSIEKLHDFTRHAVKSEAQLSEFIRLRFSLAKAVRLAPNQIDETIATQIARVLEQLPQLLDLARLPDLELIVATSGLDSAADGTADVPTYVGLPSAVAIREMRLGREALSIYTYLLLAEVGIYSMLAKCVSHDKFALFRTVEPDHVQRFFAAMPSVDHLDERTAAAESGFLWVTEESDRTTCRNTAANIARGAAIVEMLRSQTAVNSSVRQSAEERT